MSVKRPKNRLVLAFAEDGRSEAKRVSHGLQFLRHYTFSHAYTYGSNYFDVVFFVSPTVSLCASILIPVLLTDGYFDAIFSREDFDDFLTFFFLRASRKFAGKPFRFWLFTFQDFLTSFI